MFFLTPRYIKHAKLLHKGVTRFIDYKRDILPPAKLEEIAGLRSDLEAAMKARDKEKLTALNEQINTVCQNSLPNQVRSEIAENIEVFFVAIVIALGIRAYIAQPFKIPTGSMQPTLNGLIVETREEPLNANIFTHALGLFTGKTYIDVTSNHTGRLRRNDPITDHNLLVWSYSKLHFEDGHSITIQAPSRQLIDPNVQNLGLAQHVGLRVSMIPGTISPDGKPHYNIVGEPPVVKEGQLIARGILNSGDHVLVNKFAYNFRQPTRGEVFVFITKNIRGIEAGIPKEQGSQHYIKRLGGVPGDKLQIKSPNLYHNGELAKEPGFQKVMSQKDGYQGYADAGIFSGRQLNEITLGDDQYFALGDNSYNSSDSRVWGHVPQRNLVGPALFCYLPFTKHWGPIR